jgi:integrase
MTKLLAERPRPVCRAALTAARRGGRFGLPADPDALAAYLTARAEAELCNGTLDGDCAAIAHRHHQAGLGDPTAAEVVRRVRRGLRRILGTAPRRQAHPLTVAELVEIVASIDPASRIGVRDRAVLLLGYAAALRPSEIAALHLADVRVDPDGLLITIRRSKTDQEGLGQMVGVAAGLHPATDPIRALRGWLELRPAGPGPLFPRVPATRPITSEGIAPAPSATSSATALPRPDSAPSGSAATRCEPGARPRPQPTELRSTGSPPRPDTAT